MWIGNDDPPFLSYQYEDHPLSHANAQKPILSSFYEIYGLSLKIERGGFFFPNISVNRMRSHTLCPHKCARWVISNNYFFILVLNCHVTFFLQTNFTPIIIKLLLAKHTYGSAIPIWRSTTVFCIKKLKKQFFLHFTNYMDLRENTGGVSFFNIHSKKFSNAVFLILSYAQIIDL